MKKLSRNAHMLLYCLAINSITSIFIYSFLLAFILDVSKNGIVNVALFYLILHSSMILFSFILAPFFKKFNKTFCLKTGILFKLVFVVMVVFLHKDIVHYIWAISICNAIAETLFWGGANPLQPAIVEKNTLPYYVSLIKIYGTIIGLIMPIIIGSLIDGFGIYIISIMMLVMVTIQIALSIFIKHNDEEINTKLDYKGFITNQNLNKYSAKHIYFNNLLFGFCSNVSMIILYYTVTIFGSNISIGIFSTLISIISIVMLTIFNYNKKLFSTYKTAIINSLLVCLGFSFIILIPNKITLVLLYLFWNLTIVVPDTITCSKRFNIINQDELRKYNIENVTISEVFLDFGRVIGEALLLSMGLINNRTVDIIVLTIVALIVTSYYFHNIFIQSKKCD